MEIKEMESKMSSIGREIQKLKAEEREIEKYIVLSKQEKLRPLVGMTFKAGKTYFAITDVPQKEIMVNGVAFNPYQIPAIFVVEGRSDAVKIREDCVFSHAVSSDDVKAKIRSEYEEIPASVFKEKLEWAFQEIRNATNVYEKE